MMRFRFEGQVVVNNYEITSESRVMRSRIEKMIRDRGWEVRSVAEIDYVAMAMLFMSVSDEGDEAAWADFAKVWRGIVGGLRSRPREKESDLLRKWASPGL